MANDVGNLAAKLTLNAAGFAAGIAAAEKEAASLSASLQKQIDQMTLVDRSADVYRLSLQGVSREVIERIEAQQQLLSSLKQQEAAEKAAASAAEATAAAERKATAAAEAEAIANAKKAQAEAEKMAAAAAHAAAMQHQSDTSRATQIESQLIGPLGERIQRLTELTGLLRRGAIDQQTYNRAAEEINQQTQVASTGMKSLSGSAKNSSFAIQQLAFGAQDAATQFGTQGLAGAIRASSNNVIQFASLLGPMAGTIAAVVGTGIALWADYSAKQQKATDDLEKFKQELSSLNKVWGEIESRASQFKSSLESVASVESVNSVDSFRSAWQSNERSIVANDYAVRELNKEYDSLQEKIKAAQDVRNEKFSHGQEDAVVEDEKRIAELEKKAQELREKRTEVANRGLDLSRKRRLLEEKEESIFMQQQLKDQIALSDAQKTREQKAAEEKRKSDDKIKREQDKATAKAEQDAKSLASLQQSLTSDIKTPEKQIENVMTKLEERQKKINELATDPKQAASINLEAIDAATRELERVKDEQNQSLQFAGAAEFGSTEAYARSLQTENKSVSENTKQLVDLAKEQLKEARKKKEVELQEASF